MKSIADIGTGDFEVTWGTPFKTDEYVLLGSAAYQQGVSFRDYTGRALGYQSAKGCSVQVATDTTSSSAGYDSTHVYVAAFGELENE